MRDFVGYGGKPPSFEWPGGATLALTIAVNYEAGGERSPVFGDASPETFGEFPAYGVPPKRDLAMESIFEYETRVAIWRILRVLRKNGVKATFFATAKTLEVNEIAAKAIVEQGHEICSHGYRWVEHYTLTREEEREHIKKAVEIITRITGKRPVGWYCREPSENTLELLVEEGGFLYDSDVYNDDLPYYVDIKGKKLLLIPYTPDVNDFHFFSNRFCCASEFFEYMRDSFLTLYEESEETPKLMNVGIHVRISGRAGRIVALDRFLNYAKRFKRVWIATREEIARHFMRLFPP
ncbi:allantoinase [Candidatus Marsarchaeota G1 archaeon BE_D]|jgi:Predicted xylanase/chitin deacetylase|uniref:Allantoinase n=1 Tax=Candidatus Marsarchaeota G1 archaeon BE_D TaxID=1978156 RepID=A0A2R6AJ46_9ARCH|nr:MAG: allantoinase [Candidatus Marsarchaeota G1 archaeon BE_D]